MSDTPTASQYKALIISQIGDDEQQTLATFIDGAWLLYGDYVAVPGLRYLLTLRKCIELMQGRVRNLINTSREGDRRVDLDQRFKHLQTMFENTDAQIKLMEARLSASVAPAIGTITRVRPQSLPYATAEDAALFDRMLRGDAFLNLEWLPL